MASLADGGSVDKRSEFLQPMLSDVILGIPTLLDRTNLHVVGEKAVEKVDVCVTKNREVLVLLNVGLLHLEDTEAFAQLSVPLSIHFKRAKNVNLHRFIWFS